MPLENNRSPWTPAAEPMSVKAIHVTLKFAVPYWVLDKGQDYATGWASALATSEAARFIANHIINGSPD